jgi:uncharacterized membrane protein
MFHHRAHNQQSVDLDDNHLQVVLPKEVPEPLARNILAILAYQARREQQLSRPQRALDRVAVFVGQPQFLVGVMAGVVLWISVNLLMPHLGIPPFDPPQFSYLQRLIGLASLLVTNVVLFRQNRQERLADQREHLNLQVSLLAEHKITKLIELVERLCAITLPVGARDPEIETLKRSIDPQTILGVLEETLDALDRVQAAIDRAKERQTTMTSQESPEVRQK